ncbi:MAG: 2-phosphosulfolactate phosphatase [Candidatus Hydrogenedentes bacterium]|nr:2-phosphosulfolactate phosphatase [Candidatus Hydrogenedentota bacterium]
MRIHLIEGAEGCAFAVQHNCVAVVVDALRASATAAMLLQAGATELLVVREIADAFEAKNLWPDALLFGERGGLPPEGFDGGNSPQNLATAKGRRVIFTTTTGAQRLIASWGAEAVYMGTTINATAVLAAAVSHGRDIVIIPAGLASDPAFNAQEDWAAAVAIALKSKLPIASGADRYDLWRARIASEGIGSLFASSPHAAKLIPIGLGNDISFCAQVDITKCVPLAVASNPLGIVVKNAPK